MSRSEKNYKLPPSFSDSLDKELNTLLKKARMISRLREIINTIKSNGLYSESEMIKEFDKLEKMNAPEYEKKIISECWYVRRLANRQLIDETQMLLKRIKKELKKDE